MKLYKVKKFEDYNEDGITQEEIEEQLQKDLEDDSNWIPWDPSQELLDELEEYEREANDPNSPLYEREQKLKEELEKEISDREEFEEKSDKLFIFNEIEKDKKNFYVSDSCIEVFGLLYFLPLDAFDLKNDEDNFLGEPELHLRHLDDGTPVIYLFEGINQVFVNMRNVVHHMESRIANLKYNKDYEELEKENLGYEVKEWSED